MTATCRSCGCSTASRSAGASGCGFFALPTGGAVELVRPGTDLARQFFEGSAAR